MNKTALGDGTQVFCLRPPEAKVLDDHVEGYMTHGIRVEAGHTVFDVGANIGIFGVRMAQRCGGDIKLIAFEPIPEIRACTEANLKPWPTAVVLPYGIARARGTATFTYFPNAPSLSSAHLDDWNDQDGVLEEAVVGNARHAPMWYAKLLPRFLAGPLARWLTKNPIEVQCELRTVSQIMAEHHIDLQETSCCAPRTTWIPFGLPGRNPSLTGMTKMSGSTINSNKLAHQKHHWDNKKYWKY